MNVGLSLGFRDGDDMEVAIFVGSCRSLAEKQLLHVVGRYHMSAVNTLEKWLSWVQEAISLAIECRGLVTFLIGDSFTFRGEFEQNIFKMLRSKKGSRFIVRNSSCWHESR